MVTGWIRQSGHTLMRSVNAATMALSSSARDFFLCLHRHRCLSTYTGRHAAAALMECCHSKVSVRAL